MRKTLVAIAVALAACQDTRPPGTGEVLCRDLDANYATVYAGDAALADCVGDPEMQAEGHRRVAQLGPGDFDFGDGRRFELTTGFTIQGAGPDATRIFASRPTLAIFQDDIYSTLLVRGAHVRLADFTFDGFCHAGPSPGPGCGEKDDYTLLAILVACGYGMEAPPDCDVDGLAIENVRVLGVKTPFVATSSPAHPERGAKGLFANFRDLQWTIRRFQVSERSDPFHYARIFELGNGATADISRGPGVGVAAPRRYVVDIEDTDIDANVGMWGGNLAGILTIAVNDDRVDLHVNLRNSHWRGAERLVGIANHAVPGDGGDDGRVTFSCVDSALHADPLAFAGRAITDAVTTACPPFAAAAYVGEFAQPGGTHASRANLVRCPVHIESGLALCPKPASLDLGGDAAHVTLCNQDSALDPPPRGAATIAAPPCLAAPNGGTP